MRETALSWRGRAQGKGGRKGLSLVCLIRLEEEGLLSGMIVALRERLMEPDPDFGVHLGGGGKAWKKVKTWFGYGLHLVAEGTAPGGPAPKIATAQVPQP